MPRDFYIGSPDDRNFSAGTANLGGNAGGCGYSLGGGVTYRSMSAFFSVCTCGTWSASIDTKRFRFQPPYRPMFVRKTARR